MHVKVNASCTLEICVMKGKLEFGIPLDCVWILVQPDGGIGFYLYLYLCNSEH